MGDPTLRIVLATVGGWDGQRSHNRERERVIAEAARLGLRLSDSQAGALIDRSYRQTPVDLLREMVAQARRDRERREALPEPYSFAEHARRFRDANATSRARKFAALPAWKQSEAWQTLRAERDRANDELMAVAA